VNCNDFEINIDRYLDGALDSEAWRHAVDHTAACAACATMVAKYQQSAALLKTAVTDRVAAVDVSGLWEKIDAQVGPVAPLSAPTAAWPAPLGFLDRLRGWAAAELTAMRIGAAMATAAAAVALLMASLGAETTPERVARNGGVRMKSKAVRIETMEVPAGYTVSTWSRPRSRTHMISINPDPTYTFASVSR
jgi:anti-sigma factor RsiW